MQLKHIKESIKQKHSNSGNKTLRSANRILVTNKDRERYAKRKFNLQIRDGLSGGGIDNTIKKTIKRQWIKQGGTIEQLHKVGYKKALAMLSPLHQF